MTRVEVAPKILDDVDRILGLQAQHGGADAAARIMDIMQAFDVPAHNPLIGRPVATGKRELVDAKQGIRALEVRLFS
jgi:toxin ParE1/3/4